MSVTTKARKRHKKVGLTLARLNIRVRVNAPDNWLSLTGQALERWLVTTGSQCRATVHDVLGRQRTKKLDKGWAKSENWKILHHKRTKAPRRKLRALNELLQPMISSNRLEVEVENAEGFWISLHEAAKFPQRVV